MEGGLYANKVYFGFLNTDRSDSNNDLHELDLVLCIKLFYCVIKEVHRVGMLSVMVIVINLITAINRYINTKPLLLSEYILFIEIKDVRQHHKIFLI